LTYILRYAGLEVEPFLQMANQYSESAIPLIPLRRLADREM
jgi:hypothetical protein